MRRPMKRATRDAIDYEGAVLSMRMPKRDLGSHWYFITDVFVFRA